MQRRDPVRTKKAARPSALAVLLVASLLVPAFADARIPLRRAPLARTAAALPTTNWLDFTLVAENRLVTGPNLNLSGNFVVWGAGGLLDLGLDNFQLDDAPPPFMAGDTLNMGGQTSVANAYTNNITGNASAEVRGTTQTATFPLPMSLPTFPTAAVCDNCALNATRIVVDPDDTITLTPGCYGELFARQNSAVFLQPGTYTFLEWDIQKFASVTANGPVQIHIREKVATEESNFLGASSGQVLDFQVWIGARKACHPALSATHNVIGKFSFVIGTFVAPSDDNFNFNKGAILMGTAVADELDIRGRHEDRPPTPTPTSVPTPTATPHIDNTPTPTPPSNTPTPTPPFNTPTPTPPSNTPTPAVTPTPNFPTPTPTQPFTPPTPTPTPTPGGPTPTPNGSPTPGTTPTPRKLPTPTPTQPFTPPTPTPIPSIAPPPPTPNVTPTAAPRKHPWGKKSGLIESLFPSRTGSRIAPSMKRPLGVRR